MKVKLGNVSNQLEQAIPNSSIEKLNTLTLSIFAITNEDDILKIIKLIYKQEKARHFIWLAFFIKKKSTVLSYFSFVYFFDNVSINSFKRLSH